MPEIPSKPLVMCRFPPGVLKCLRVCKSRPEKRLARLSLPVLFPIKMHVEKSRIICKSIYFLILPHHFHFWQGDFAEVNSGHHFTERVGTFLKF